MTKKILKLLYRSFDLELSPKEKEALKKALEGSVELKREKKRIESMRESFSKSEAGKFSPYFKTQIMDRIKKLNNNTGEQNNFFNSFVYDFKIIAAGAVILLGILLTFSFINNSSTVYDEDNISMNELVEPIAMLEMEDLL
jgi:hypothetical protein